MSAAGIPAEAVEAAIEALRTPPPNCPPQGVLSWREIALTVLEAAAPHLMATGLHDVADKMRNERATWCLDDSGRYWIGRTLNELTEYADDLPPNV